VSKKINNLADYPAGSWVAACGGTEQPFALRGKKFLYMWNYVTKTHGYYCITDDVFVKQLRGY